MEKYWCGEVENDHHMIGKFHVANNLCPNTMNHSKWLGETSALS